QLYLLVPGESERDHWHHLSRELQWIRRADRNSCRFTDRAFDQHCEHCVQRRGLYECVSGYFEPWRNADALLRIPAESRRRQSVHAELVGISRTGTVTLAHAFRRSCEDYSRHDSSRGF